MEDVEQKGGWLPFSFAVGLLVAFGTMMMSDERYCKGRKKKVANNNYNTGEMFSLCLFLLLLLFHASIIHCQVMSGPFTWLLAILLAVVQTPEPRGGRRSSSSSSMKE